MVPKLSVAVAPPTTATQIGERGGEWGYCDSSDGLCDE